MVADGSMADRAPDASTGLPDGSPALPDIVRDASAVLPDAPPDAVFALPDAPAFLDVASALPDAPRDGSAMVPDVPPDFSSVLPDASNEVLLPDAGVFCSGDTSHMVVNGIESYPLVSGGLIPLDCCEGGVFHITTDTFASLISVTWRTTKQVPATVDLANLPTGWGVRVEIGCDPMSAVCISAPDSYTSGLTGTLQVSNVTTGWDMSLCLSLAESPSSPHPLVHTLELYVPHVHAGY
jgi:hypothetical protein